MKLVVFPLLAAFSTGCVTIDDSRERLPVSSLRSTEYEITMGRDAPCDLLLSRLEALGDRLRLRPVQERRRDSVEIVFTDRAGAVVDDQPVVRIVLGGPLLGSVGSCLIGPDRYVVYSYSTQSRSISMAAGTAAVSVGRGPRVRTSSPGTAKRVDERRRRKRAGR